jgi:hypothetical protein
MLFLGPTSVTILSTPTGQNIGRDWRSPPNPTQVAPSTASGTPMIRVLVQVPLPRKTGMVTFLDPNQYFQVQVLETRESEDSNMEKIDLMDALHTLEDNIWDPSPLTNLRLKIKMRQVVHSETMGILSLCHMPIEPVSERYKKTYITMFKALVDKKVAKKTSDSQASTPSISGLTQFLSKEDADATYQLNLNYRMTILTEAQLPPTPLTPGIITFTDPLDNTRRSLLSPTNSWWNPQESWGFPGIPGMNQE